MWAELGGTLVPVADSDAAAVARVLGPELFPWTLRGIMVTSSYGGAVAQAWRGTPESAGLGRETPLSVAAVLAG